MKSENGLLVRVSLDEAIDVVVMVHRVRKSQEFPVAFFVSQQKFLAMVHCHDVVPGITQDDQLV